MLSGCDTLVVLGALLSEEAVSGGVVPFVRKPSMICSSFLIWSYQEAIEYPKVKGVIVR